MVQEQRILFDPATTKRASQVIYDQICQKILTGELKPGDHLPSERCLAEQFQRSRPSVREALRMLQQDGLLEITVGSSGGAIVRGISLKTVAAPLKKIVDYGVINLNELVEYRHINDRGCARLAAVHYTDEDARNIQEILDYARESIDDPLSFQKYDIAFHNALAVASHNQLAMLINNVIVELNTKVFLDAIIGYSVRQQQELNRLIYESHNAIFQAVLARDPVTADERVGAMIQLFIENVH